MIKKKFIPLFFLILLSLVNITLANNVRTEPFNVYFSNGSSLGFQNDNEYVLLDVTAGNLNSSTNTLRINVNGGTFQFLANETVTLQISFNTNKVKVSGDQGGELRQIANLTSISANINDVVLITWEIRMTFWFPISFVLGIVGLFSTFGGSLLLVNEVKKKNYEEGFQSGVIFCAIGIALVIIWLW